jgi:PAS domain-containing protein
LKAFQSERAAGESLASAYQVALFGILTSREFIYLVEGDVSLREKLTDFELASRLSYFLWSSMPDDELFSKAAAGDLTGQVERMLDDEKISRFLEDFPRQWLQLHRVGMFPPDEKLYPGYDVWLETSMREEVVRYFEEIFRNNGSMEGLIDSNWTMANPRLCEFYGLPESKKSGFQKVFLKPEDHRGGLLTMGAILGLTSDGTRHRPVHRGVWVSDAILGKTPPPPPANVNAIEPNPSDVPKATIRQKIEAHASDVNCAACHRRIDPLGLAFDEYDAIGRWRTHERVEKGFGEDPPVNPGGVMPDGRAFEGAAQFKKLLLDDRDQFLQAFVEHLCTYALRRVLTVDDRDDVRAIVAEAKRNQYQLKSVVRAVALSDLIRKR